MYDIYKKQPISKNIINLEYSQFFNHYYLYNYFGTIISLLFFLGDFYNDI